jgi:hypothetical protein
VERILLVRTKQKLSNKDIKVLAIQFCVVLGLPTTCTGVSNGTRYSDRRSLQRIQKKDLELCRWIFWDGSVESKRWKKLERCYTEAGKVQAKMTEHNLTEREFPLLRLPQGIVDVTWKETVHLEAK